MAEHTMGLLIALARNFPDSVRHQDRAIWSQQQLWDKHPLTELNGKLLVIVGYGSIGHELARRAMSFDMRVWGVSRSGKGDATLAEKIVPVAQLREVLSRADYVVVSAPETPETHHLIGAPEIALLKPTACLLNVARGSLLDQTALISALHQGRLAGAALDVTDPEPLPADHPLWKTPNLFLTPHTSAISDRLWPRQTALFLDLLQCWFDGRDLFNLVDLHRGY
jgi:phosphoglycerate dehydrogenase-like enzyme